ncbi:hypothetical protein KAH94_05375 [bacterium]|nr:hypothetical protein [bacterium]
MNKEDFLSYLYKIIYPVSRKELIEKLAITEHNLREKDMNIFIKELKEEGQVFFTEDSKIYVKLKIY